MGSHHRLGRGPLQKRPCFRIEGLAQKVVRAGVTDVELDGRVQHGELTKSGRLWIMLISSGGDAFNAWLNSAIPLAPGECGRFRRPWAKNAA